MRRIRSTLISSNLSTAICHVSVLAQPWSMWRQLDAEKRHGCGFQKRNNHTFRTDEISVLNFYAEHIALYPQIKTVNKLRENTIVRYTGIMHNPIWRKP